MDATIRARIDTGFTGHFFALDSLSYTIGGNAVKAYGFVLIGGRKGATTAHADITHTAEGADHEAIDCQLYHGGVAVGPLTDAQLRATPVPVDSSGSTLSVDNFPASFGIASFPAHHGKTVARAVIAQGGAGTTELIAAGGGSIKHKIVGLVLTLSAAGTVKFQRGSTDLTGAMDVAAAGGFVLPYAGAESPWLETAANEAFSIVTTGGAAKGFLIYVSEA